MNMSQSSYILCWSLKCLDEGDNLFRIDLVNMMIDDDEERKRRRKRKKKE
jgi:hypothetical protein